MINTEFIAIQQIILYLTFLVLGFISGCYYIILKNNNEILTSEDIIEPKIIDKYLHNAIQNNSPFLKLKIPTIAKYAAKLRLEDEYKNSAETFCSFEEYLDLNNNRYQEMVCKYINDMRD